MRDIIGLLSLQKRIAPASSRWNSAGSNVSIAAMPPSELAVWFSTPLVGDKNKQQADDPGAGGPCQFDEKQIEGEVHAGRTYAGFPLAVVIGKGHQ